MYEEYFNQQMFLGKYLLFYDKFIVFYVFWCLFVLSKLKKWLIHQMCKPLFSFLILSF